jgi:hypothetical protein
MRKPARLAVSLGAVAATATALAGVAQALPASASTVQARTAAVPHVVKVTVPMKVTGFDAAVARAHGYVIRTDAQGREYSVQAGAAATASASADAVSPDNVIDGNCGSSYLYEYAVGNHAVDIQTGFNVTTPAVAYWWKYWMRDPGGTSSHTHSGGLAARTSWADDERWGALTPGPASAWVDTGSDALLDNGGVCTSGGPSSSATIY